MRINKKKEEYNKNKNTLDLLLLNLYVEEEIKKNQNQELVNWYKKQVENKMYENYLLFPNLFEKDFDPEKNIKNVYSKSYYDLFEKIKKNYK
jgi:hypothetical protein